MTTIAGHENRHVISYATARSDLLKLEEWGYLKRTVRGNRYDFVAAKKESS